MDTQEDVLGKLREPFPRLGDADLAEIQQVAAGKRYQWLLLDAVADIGQYRARNRALVEALERFRWHAKTTIGDETVRHFDGCDGDCRNPMPASDEWRCAKARAVLADKGEGGK